MNNEIDQAIAEFAKNTNAMYQSKADKAPAVKQEKGGTKADEGKLRWDLLPAKMLRGVVRVLMGGAKDKGPWNWAKGIEFTRLINSTRRHLDAVELGEDTDGQYGEMHIDHAIASLLFLRHQVENACEKTSDEKHYYYEFDDRTVVGKPLHKYDWFINSLKQDGDPLL